MLEDEKLSIQLFDELNMRDPLKNQPAFLYENGINAADLSLRQIMAEQAAEETKYKLKKSNTINFLPQQPIQAKKINSTNDISSKLKLDLWYQKYGEIVDKKRIEEIYIEQK